MFWINSRVLNSQLMQGWVIPEISSGPFWTVLLLLGGALLSTAVLFLPRLPLLLPAFMNMLLSSTSSSLSFSAGCAASAPAALVLADSGPLLLLLLFFLPLLARPCLGGCDPSVAFADTLMVLEDGRLP